MPTPLCQRHNGPSANGQRPCFNSTLTINSSKLKLLCYHSRFSSILAKKTNFRTGCELPHMKLNVQTIGLKPHPTLTTVGIFKTENYFSSCRQPEKAKAQGHLLSERSLQWVKVRLQRLSLYWGHRPTKVWLPHRYTIFLYSLDVGNQEQSWQAVSSSLAHSCTSYST